jgi:YVTN family beta-propeller protein
MKITFTDFFSIALLSAFLIFQSCSKDKDAGKGAFQTGVLVANEGQFGSSNGDVTYYNSASALLEQNIYKTVNGSFAGNVLQSIFLDGDVGYLVVNADNKIEIINDNTFALQNTFTDPKLINPRYLQVINGNAYISVWGAFNADFNLTDSYIMVVDLKTLTVITTIATDLGTENLVYNGQYLFASNYNYGGSNTITVVDPSTNKVVKSIKVQDGPSGMVLDANNKLWVITTGNNAQLDRINTTSLAVEDSIAIGSSPGIDLAISVDKKTLIYSIGNSVYQLPIAAGTASTTSWFDANDVVAFYSLGADPKTGEVYIGDALNYSSAGEVYIYNADGTFKTKFVSGISPGQFIFR